MAHYSLHLHPNPPSPNDMDIFRAHSTSPYLHQQHTLNTQHYSQSPPDQSLKNPSSNSVNSALSAFTPVFDLEPKTHQQSQSQQGPGPEPQSKAYGIIDELNTTLWDLKDGPDGYSGKPPYPYLTLIRIALISSESKKLTLQELYDTLEQRYPFFKGEAKGWKNSIRHNLSLNRCFKKESRHVLDPGKGSYWYVDLQEEHSTPRVRNRRKTNDSNGPAHQDSIPDSRVAKGKKRKYSPAFTVENSPERDVKPRILDLKLPASSLTIPLTRPTGRMRAISAPSPVSSNFYSTLPNVAGHPQPFTQQLQHLHQHPFGLGQHQHYFGGLPYTGYSYSAPLQQHTYTYPPIVGGTPVDVQPYLAPMIPMTSLASASPASHMSGENESDKGSSTPVDSSQVLSVSVPTTAPGMVLDNVPSSGGSTCSSGFDHPETPHTVFPESNNKKTAVNGSAASPPPGPSNAYSFPSQESNSTPQSGRMEIVTVPSNQQRHIPPLLYPHGHSHSLQGPQYAALNRSIPPPLLMNVHHQTKEGKLWSPLQSAGIAQSPTRLLPTNDYDKLFSSAPFGMYLSEAPRKGSRSNSIFGVTTR